MASPANIEPTPQSPSRMPVSSRWPVASSAAGTATSTAPTDRPQSTKTAMSTRTPGPRSGAGEVARDSPRAGATRARSGCAAKARSPTSRKAAQASHGDAGRPRADARDDEDGTADVDDLEQRALHRVGGVAAVRRCRAAPATARACTRRPAAGGAGDGRGGEDRAERGAVGEQRRARRSAAAASGAPTRRTSVCPRRSTTRASAGLESAEGDRVGARRQAALGVGAGELLGVQDEQQPERAHGQPRDARGEEEAEGAGGAQDVTHARQGDDRRRACETIRFRPYPWRGSARRPRGRAGCACSRARRRSRSASRRCR